MAGLGRVTQMTGQDGTSDYGYDTTSQLTSAVHTFQTSESYTYDVNGNRTMTGWQTGTDNRLLNDGTYSYEYDKEGNRTKRTKTATGDVTEYAWDYRNRLVRVTEKDMMGTMTKVVEYTYDVFNRRIAKQVDTTGPFDMADAAIERYVVDDIHTGLVSLDGGNVVLDFTDPDGAGSQPIALAKRYLYGKMVDQILAQEDVSKTLGDAARVLWPLVDNLGTVRDLARQDGTIATHYTYDAYGNVTSGDTSLTRYLFTSRELDTETGLQYNRARWYDAEVGRWISEDPLGFAAGDGNVTRYVGNGATNGIDPSGLLPPGGGMPGGAFDRYAMGIHELYPVHPGHARPPQTPDEETVEQFAGDDPHAIQQIHELFYVLDHTWVWPVWPNRCHAWCGEFLNQYDVYVPPLSQLHVRYVFPRYVGWVLGWKDHGVIIVTVKGHRFYLDKSLQGGSDYISFEPRRDLIYPDDPRYDDSSNGTEGDLHPAIDNPGDPRWNMYYGP